MDNTMITKIVLRNDSTSNWEAVGDTVILLQGEIGVEFPDDGSEPKLKMGDGVTIWNELPYIKTEGVSTDIESQVEVLKETVNGFDIRIQNAESGVTASVTAADNALTEVGILRTEMNEKLSTQDEDIAALDATVAEGSTAIEAMNAEIEEVKNTQDTQQLEIDAANARVDNLVAGYTDDTDAANLELIDIRAGYDGTVHASAGAAVRQIGYDLNELSQNLEGALGKDIVDGLAYEDNMLYLTCNGEMVGEAVEVVSGGTGSGGTSQTL